MAEPTQSVPSRIWRDERLADGSRVVPEETAVALTYDGSTYAVMMATPADLEDFAVGFSLTETIVGCREAIEDIALVDEGPGIELRVRLQQASASALAERRRRMAGPVGCGLCGIESLTEAMRPVPVVTDACSVSASSVRRAVRRLADQQPLNRLTHAIHAASFFDLGGHPMIVREDVGRHNAFDKLAGALARDGMNAGGGFVVLTSRLSVELVQKAATIGVPVLVGVSAPTALAVRTAEEAGLTLVGVARDDGFEVFAGSRRIVMTETADYVA